MYVSRDAIDDIKEWLDYEKILIRKCSRQLSKQDDFMDIFGAWSEDDLSEFNKASSDFSKVDPGDWS